MHILLLEVIRKDFLFLTHSYKSVSNWLGSVFRIYSRQRLVYIRRIPIYRRFRVACHLAQYFRKALGDFKQPDKKTMEKDDNIELNVELLMEHAEKILNDPKLGFEPCISQLVEEIAIKGVIYELRLELKMKGKEKPNEDVIV